MWPNIVTASLPFYLVLSLCVSFCLISPQKQQWCDGYDVCGKILEWTACQGGSSFVSTPSLDVYERLKNKWDTYQMMTEYGIPTPPTCLYDVTRSPLTNNRIRSFPTWRVDQCWFGGVALYDAGRIAKSIMGARSPTRNHVRLITRPNTDIRCNYLCGNSFFSMGSRSYSAEDLAGAGASYYYSQKNDT